ncbi:MAG: hypothetical protein QOD33_255 [Pyrinomonadaceae bacterium]|nr:hypothetical protein [Pyrinomonadaceae bacterium]
MSTGIERPLFFENQILGAADLTASVEHSRGQEARHNRYLHLWGIAYGLELSGEDAEENNQPFKKITLSAGMAIDGTGREIIVPQSEALSENTFSQLQLTAGVNLAEVWFPVFLVGKDQPAQQPPLATARCDSSAPSRKVEGYEITFRRPGEARTLDEQAAGNVADGPGAGGWKILLGFVQSNANGDKFTDFKYEVSGIGRKYAGVQADEVAARSGSLKLRTRTTPEANKPALLLDETGDGLLQFGSLDALGRLQAVFSVNAKGDVKAEGKIIGALTTKNVQIESGIATDGVVLPLPPGITEKQVADGDAIVQTHISLRMTGETSPPGAAPSTDQWGASPLEVWVDSERRVHCKARWFRMIGSSGRVEDHPAACNYMVLASVKETQP